MTGTHPSATSEADSLERFVLAQQSQYEVALAEIRAGRKQTHWMWYIFPQLRGRGRSAMAHAYGVRDRDEAAAYLQHPLLGPRLIEIAQALLDIEGRTAREVLGSPDDLKLRSCCTLFARIAPPGSVFEQVLAKHFAGQPDPQTLRLLD